MRPSNRAAWALMTKLELGRLHDRQVCRLGALEDAARIYAGLTMRFRPARSVAHQPTDFGVGPRQCSPRYQPSPKCGSLSGPRRARQFLGEERARPCHVDLMSKGPGGPPKGPRWRPRCSVSHRGLPMRGADRAIGNLARALPSAQHAGFTSGGGTAASPRYQ